MQKIQRNSTIFKFRDGQEVVLYEPTLAMLEKSELMTKDMDKVKTLLIDISNGELDIDFLNSLPALEFERLSQHVAPLLQTSAKN